MENAHFASLTQSGSLRVEFYAKREELKSFHREKKDHLQRNDSYIDIRDLISNTDRKNNGITSTSALEH